MRENDLHAGPKKQPFMGYLLYIAKGDKHVLGEIEDLKDAENDIDTEEEILENSSYNS